MDKYEDVFVEAAGTVLLSPQLRAYMRFAGIRLEPEAGWPYRGDQCDPPPYLWKVTRGEREEFDTFSACVGLIARWYSIDSGGEGKSA